MRRPKISPAKYVPVLEVLMDRDHKDWNRHWAELFNIFYPVLFTWNRMNRALDKWDVQEITTLAIERVYANLHKYNPEEGENLTFFSWVKVVNFNVRADYCRSKLNNDCIVYDENMIDKDYIAATDDMIDYSMKVKLIEKEVPREYARAFLLTNVLGMSHEEACKKLSVSSSTLRQRVHQARKYIKNNLIKHFELC
ncbi:hypothetical protein AGMMS50239_38910 [Bacteroidia bacterium]|nr:hypothetical protein AGMMS50239_38910 [Bacteroidia bacterium]